ncbi:MAG TPA: hypothetical protein VJT31_24315 [Rugosimonospora sp.]|nr:hypothetical protein [Rugosimonospora sp.]
MSTGYGWLLRLYPKAYRQQRGAEMLTTLVEAAEAGRRRPVWREVTGLVLGAARIRTGAATGVSLGQRWLGALRISVLFLVAHGTAKSLALARLAVPIQLSHPSDPYPATFAIGASAGTVCGLLAIVLLAAGRYRTGMVATLAAFVASQISYNGLPNPFRLTPNGFWQYPLAALLMLPLLVRRPAAARRPVTWLLAVPVAWLVLTSGFHTTLNRQPWPLVAVAFVCLLWTVVDGRVAIAGAALVFGLAAWPVYAELAPSIHGSTLTLVSATLYPSLTVILFAAGTVRIRQQARL